MPPAHADAEHSNSSAMQAHAGLATCTARTSDFDAILKQTKELGEFRVKTENYSEENIERMVKACAPHLLAELLKT